MYHIVRRDPLDQAFHIRRRKGTVGIDPAQKLIDLGETAVIIVLQAQTVFAHVLQGPFRKCACDGLMHVHAPDKPGQRLLLFPRPGRGAERLMSVQHAMNISDGVFF